MLPRPPCRPDLPHPRRPPLRPREPAGHIRNTCPIPSIVTRGGLTHGSARDENGVRVRLTSVEAENFRGFGKAEIPLRDQITVIIGENNAGKSTLLDALRLLTDPLDDRRSLYWDTDDVARIPSADNATLVANYELTTPSQHGLYGQAVVPGTDRVRYAVTFTPPPDARLRGRISWTAGNGATTDRDPEPAARDRLRHVYLPPLRDAHRELSTSSGARVRTILKYLLAETGDTEEGLVKHVQSAFGEVLGHRVFQTTSRAIRGPLADMTAGARRQTSDLAFADPDLLSISRALRIRMNEYGLSPREVAESGLGYANLLFIATVLVELRASRQQDLTLFLVEEPEAHLHPQLQALLLGYLRDAARLTNQAPGTDGFASRIQIVVATHSPQLASSTSVDDLVVLKRTRFHGAGGPTSAPSATAPARAESAPTRACAEPSGPAAAAHGVDERGPESGIRPVPLGQLGLPDGTTAKLQRYLDATRSAMFFAPRVLLVEGLAEALLLPVFAHRVLAPPEPEAVFPLLDEETTPEPSKSGPSELPGSGFEARRSCLSTASTSSRTSASC